MQPAAKPEPRGLTREKVSEVIATVVSRMGDRLNTTQVKVAWELEQLAKQIDGLYGDLSSFNAPDIKGSHLPSAHDELGAVVAATAEATGTIMDACDIINKATATLAKEQAEPIVGAVMNIYEACSFQDITGQRINKVIKTLQMIEGKIDSLIETLNGSAAEGSPAMAEQAPTGDAALLNGPAMPGKAISQDEIDKLLGF